jgi:hypothetical protein
MVCDLCGGRKFYRASITENLPCTQCKGTGELFINENIASIGIQDNDKQDESSDVGIGAITKKRGRPKKQ